MCSPQPCSQKVRNWLVVVGFSLVRVMQAKMSYTKLLAKGFAQIEGTDYTDTFAPTAKMGTIRMLLQVAAHHDMLIRQLDVKTAYLNAPIDCAKCTSNHQMASREWMVTIIYWSGD